LLISLIIVDRKVHRAFLGHTRARSRVLSFSVSFSALLAGKLFVNSGKYVVRHTGKANIIFRARRWKVEMINRVNSTRIAGLVRPRGEHKQENAHVLRTLRRPRFNGTTFLPKERASRRRMLCSYVRACKCSSFRERCAREKRGSDSGASVGLSALRFESATHIERGGGSTIKLQCGPRQCGPQTS